MLCVIVTIFLSLFIIGLFILGSAPIENMVVASRTALLSRRFLMTQIGCTVFQQEVQGWDTVESVTYGQRAGLLRSTAQP